MSRFRPFVFLLLWVNIALSQTDKLESFTANNLEEIINKEQKFFYSIVENLLLHERPCSLHQYRLAVYVSVLVCAETNMTFDAFSTQFDEKVAFLAEQADSEYVNIIDKSKWEKSLTAEPSPYAIGGITEDENVFALFYTSYQNRGYIVLHFTVGQPLLGSVMEMDKEGLSNFYRRKSLADTKQFMLSVVGDIFSYFQAEKIECNVSLMKFEEYGKPFCGAMSEYASDFKSIASAYFGRIVPSSPLRLLKEKQHEDLQDSDFIVSENGLYLPFYFVFPFDDFKYALRFVESDTGNVIAIYPPKFE